MAEKLGGAYVVTELSNGNEAGDFHLESEVLCSSYNGESTYIKDACVC